MRVRIVGVAAAAVVLAITGATPATAAPPSFDGAAGFTTIGNFSPLTLSGNDQLTTATVAPFVITDDSGALAGAYCAQATIAITLGP